MGALKNRFRNQQQQESRQHQNEPSDGAVTLVTALDRPIHGELNGESVRILATGNVVGMSPAYLCVDSEGISAWVSIQDVLITDPNFKASKQ